MRISKQSYLNNKSFNHAIWYVEIPRRIYFHLIIQITDHNKWFCCCHRRCGWSLPAAYLSLKLCRTHSIVASCLETPFCTIHFYGFWSQPVLADSWTLWWDGSFALTIARCHIRMSFAFIFIGVPNPSMLNWIKQQRNTGKIDNYLPDCQKQLDIKSTNNVY